MPKAGFHFLTRDRATHYSSRRKIWAIHKAKVKQFRSGDYSAGRDFVIRLTRNVRTQPHIKSANGAMTFLDFHTHAESESYMSKGHRTLLLEIVSIGGEDAQLWPVEADELADIV